jgi:hypothetical protein
MLDRKEKLFIAAGAIFATIALSVVAFYGVIGFFNISEKLTATPCHNVTHTQTVSLFGKNYLESYTLCEIVSR